jgi:arylsulfatase A-like enzyme
MTDQIDNSRNPSRRSVLGAAGALLGANLAPPPALAALAQLSLPAKAPDVPPLGYHILFVLVDQEHFFEKWPFPVPGREYLKKYGTAFLNHQGASQVCSSARSVVYTGQHIQHTGVFDNMDAPWQPDMSTDVLTIGHRMQQIGYHAAYQGKWHLSANRAKAHHPVDASLLKNREIIESYGFLDFLGVGDLIDGPLGGYSYDNLSTESAVTWLRTTARELKTQGRPWFMAVNLVNPHDVMYVNSDAPGETVQGKASARPIERPPSNETYLAEWDVPLPATRRQPLDAPGRPPAHLQYQLTQDIFVGQWPDEDRRWSVLQNYYFNCIRDCDRHLVRLLEELTANELQNSTIVVFTADHGELGGAHQMRGKGANAYREQQHLPLMILHPAYRGGRSTKAISSQLVGTRSRPISNRRRLARRAMSLRAIPAPLWFVATLVPMVASQVVRLQQSDPAAWIFWDYAGRLGALAVLGIIPSARTVAFRWERLRIARWEAALWIVGIVLVDH